WPHFWYELGDLLPDMSPQIAKERLPFLQNLRQHASVQSAIDALTLDEKTIVKLRYGVLQDDELTLRDIGEILGLSRERVRQIESRAEAKCRRSVRRDRQNLQNARPHHPSHGPSRCHRRPGEKTHRAHGDLHPTASV